jgi:hypothetical protein
VAITLGKDCSISLGGNIASARSVTITESARTIDIEAFGSRMVEVYNTGYDATVSVELNDSSDINFDLLENGTSITVSGGSGGWSFPAVVTGIAETFSVDGVATFSVECKMTRTGLR